MTTRTPSSRPKTVDRLTRTAYLRSRLQELQLLSEAAQMAESFGPAVSALEESRKVRAELDEILAQEAAVKAPVDGSESLAETLRSVRRSRAGAEASGSYTAIASLAKTEAELVRQIREEEAASGLTGSMTEAQAEEALILAITSLPDVARARVMAALGG